MFLAFTYLNVQFTYIVKQNIEIIFFIEFAPRFPPHPPPPTPSSLLQKNIN